MLSPISCSIAAIIAVLASVYSIISFENNTIKTAMVIVSFVVLAACSYIGAQIKFQSAADIQLEKTKNENENLKRNLVQVYEAVRQSKASESLVPPRNPVVAEPQGSPDEGDTEDEGKPYM